ncbi:MAG: hypothetical protein ACOYMF_04055 [Bacteroidales bacterium]
MRKVLFVFFITSIFIIPRGKAQEIKAFSSDSIEFLRELNVLFQKVGDNDMKEAKEALAAFSFDWNSGLLNNNQRQLVNQTCTKFLQHKLKTVPYFTNYLSNVVLLIRRNFSQKNFESFHKGVEFYLKIKKTLPLSGYLQCSRELLENYTLFSSYTSSWKVRQAQFTFSFDTIPVVVFSTLNLVCLLKKDSANIYQTQGRFYPAIARWKGNGGIVYWERAGLPREEAYAQLANYDILLRNTAYSADSVSFYFRKYFNRPLPGKLNEKVMSDVIPEKAIFPQFTSYLPNLIIENLYRGIDYEGGFTIEGTRVIGSGNKNTDAKIFIKRNGKLQLILRGQDFIIRPDRFTSQRASVSLYFEGDSIYHPGLQIKYNDAKRDLTLIRGDEGLSQCPYYDSYHKINILAEAIYWQLDSETMTIDKIRGLSNKSEAIFESVDYYSRGRYDEMQGIDELNPINVVMNYVNHSKSKEFFVYELAEYMNKPLEQVRALLIRLATKGFLLFDVTNDRAFVKSRLEEFLASNSGRRDYDVIQFVSMVGEQKNATLNLQNFDMNIHGVPQVSLSDSSAVYIYPKNREITLKKDRDFEFTGRVHAGYFNFYAQKSSFEYEKFRLNLPQIDSMSFVVNSNVLDDHGNPTFIKVQNVISNLSGDLLVDDPHNKSGLKPYSIYPVFNSKTESYVYYDKKSIQKGAYKRDKFFYAVDPFTMDSLNNFTIEGLQFAGKFNSGGIIPDIRQPLKVQDDYSLGFVKPLGAEGVPVYGGKGTYHFDSKLSNLGLQGKGTLNFLTSTISSDNFLFLPDRLTADAKTFDFTSTVGEAEFPQVNVINSQVFWMPYTDSMIVSNKAPEKIHIFQNKADLNGSITLTKKGLSGSGVMDFEDAQTTAGLYYFYSNSFTSETADFLLFTPDKKNVAVSADNFKLLIDFSKRIGDFRRVGSNSKVEFPFNSYTCNVDEFEWQMDNKQLTMLNHIPGEEEKLRNMSMDELLAMKQKGSEYISTDPKQDSLRFFALNSKYDILENLLHAEGARIIRVADAAVFPGDGKLTVNKDGHIQQLSGATIIANTVSKLHNIYNASVNIASRNRYSAKGLYDYKPIEGSPEIIHFDLIAVDTSGQTHAIAHVSDSAKLLLSPYFDFQGDITLHAGKEFLNFDGGFRLKNECDKKFDEWIKFACELNPANIRIKLPEKIKNLKNEDIEIGLLYSTVDNRLYPAFLQKTEMFSDPQLISAKGTATFDRTLFQYQVADSASLNDKSLAGNKLNLDTEKCILSGEGKVNLCSDLGQVKLQTTGSVKHFIIPDSTIASVFATLDFFFADEALNIFVADLTSVNLKATDLNDITYKRGLTALVGKESASKLISEISSFGVYRRFPDELNHTIILSQVKMSWNPELKSFVSTNQIGISNIQKEAINKYTDGYIEIGRKRSGDIISAYFELSPTLWYFFSYSNGIMQAMSSNKAFNVALTSVKDDKRRKKVKDKEKAYQYIVSTKEKRDTFLRKMHAVHEKSEE